LHLGFVPDVANDRGSPHRPNDRGSPHSPRRVPGGIDARKLMKWSQEQRIQQLFPRAGEVVVGTAGVGCMTIPGCCHPLAPRHSMVSSFPPLSISRRLCYLFGSAWTDGWTAYGGQWQKRCGRSSTAFRRFVGVGRQRAAAARPARWSRCCGPCHLPVRVLSILQVQTG
jgi:hypothetical protein